MSNEILIDDYKRRLKTVELSIRNLPKGNDKTYNRLTVKASCYRTFISELEQAASQPPIEAEGQTWITSELYKIGAYLVTGGQIGIDTSNWKGDISKRMASKVQIMADEHNDNLRKIAVRIKSVIDKLPPTEVKAEGANG